MEPRQQTTTVHDVELAHLELGEGPLALCLHGFPDSAWTWRHLLPALAEAGYRAVAPFLRGYAPSAVPADGRYQTAALGLDACALHEALGGGDDAVIIGHDWGAMATYVAASHEPDRWRRVVAMAVPPAAAVAGGFMTYAQLKRSWYMFFFQHPLADVVVGMDDLA
ncbi:MAG: alpha/beta fold hydrolase, partial [Actinomycetota bacterium]